MPRLEPAIRIAIFMELICIRFKYIKFIPHVTINIIFAASYHAFVFVCLVAYQLIISDLLLSDD
jgi:hypothetical protein